MASAKYINPYTDFGFKKLFGEETSKEELKDFLNELLPEKHKIDSLTLKQSEQIPDSSIERKAIFDIYCETDSGTKFIVEMQKAKLDFFKERAVFYMTFPIRAQAEKGDWNFELKPVYCIAILDFVFEKPEAPEKILEDHINTVRLKDDYCRVFYDKLAYIFIEMPKFYKKETELNSRLDKWLYFLKHLEDFDNIPSIFNEPVFLNSFQKAELANFNLKERDAYEESLKNYRDMKGVIETAFSDGKKSGVQEGIGIGIEKGIDIGELKKASRIAKNCMEFGFTDEKIQEITELTIDEIKELRKNLQDGNDII